MQLLVYIADLPQEAVLHRTDDGWFAMVSADGGQFEICGDLDMPSIRYRAAGEPLTEVGLHVWGDIESDACWFPFALLPESEVYGPHDALDCSQAVLRIRELLERVTFQIDDEFAGRSARAVVAVDYLRLRSGVTEPWHVSLARPFEVLLDDTSIGDDGLLMAFGELPPGLAELGKRACVALVHGSRTEITVRPVIATFGSDLTERDAAADALRAAHRRLAALGFTDDEVTQLNAVAVRAANMTEF
ncbi:MULTISPECIES: hypothetical protein [unclassified Sphingomonas]|nr:MULTISPECIES: hypothetical protein [unclassified Sphingomonas]